MKKKCCVAGFVRELQHTAAAESTESHPQKGTSNDQRASAPRGGRATSRVAPPEANIADMLRKRRHVRCRANRRETATLLRLQNKTGEINSTHVCFSLMSSCGDIARQLSHIGFNLEMSPLRLAYLQQKAFSISL